MTGNRFSDLLCDLTHLGTVCRVKELRNKITDLEAEVDRLSQALEVQTAATAEARTASKKGIDDLTRELHRKVRKIQTRDRELVDIFSHRLQKLINFGLS